VERALRALSFGSSRIAGVRALGFQAGHSFAPRAWLAFGVAGSAAPLLSKLGRLVGETLASTLAAQTVLRVRKGKAANAAHGLIWPTAAPLVRNSPRGWTPRSLTTIRLSGRRAGAWSRCRPRPLPEPRVDAEAMAGSRLPNTFLAPVPACLPECPRCVRAGDAARFGSAPRRPRPLRRERLASTCRATEARPSVSPAFRDEAFFILRHANET
jgi:hypothetical protein